jgi:hypothetical protein
MRLVVTASLSISIATFFRRFVLKPEKFVFGVADVSVFSSFIRRERRRFARFCETLESLRNDG